MERETGSDALIKLAEADLLKCCASKRWAQEMAAHSFPNPKEVLATADSIWWGLKPEDWHEAFAAHPRIGERTEQQWAREEQFGTRHASDGILTEIKQANQQYEQRFGHIFIVMASGKSADQMLKILRERLANDPETELRIAAQQQLEITHLRLKRLLAR